MRGGAVGFGEIVIEVRWIVFFVGAGGDAEKDVEDEDLCAIIGGCEDSVGVVFLPEEGGFGEFAEGVVIDADDEDVFDGEGASEDEMDVLGFEVQKLEEAEVGEAHGGGYACDGDGDYGGGFFAAGAHGLRGNLNISVSDPGVSDLREELGMSDGREERVEREERIEQERLKERESPREREDLDEWEPERVDS